MGKRGPKPGQGNPPKNKIVWTEIMLTKLEQCFPTRYNRELAKEIGVSIRTLIRKARELGIEKEPGFLDKRRDEITEMAKATEPWKHPESIRTQKAPAPEGFKACQFQPGEHRYPEVGFKKGQPSPMLDPEIREKAHKNRNKTIAKDRDRINRGLSPRTKLVKNVTNEKKLLKHVVNRTTKQMSQQPNKKLLALNHYPGATFEQDGVLYMHHHTNHASRTYYYEKV